MQNSIQAAAQAAAGSAMRVGREEFMDLEKRLRGELDSPDDSISLDLLSPVPSRDPSPRRLRPKSKSPARWKILRSISDAIQDVMSRRAPGVYSTSY